MPVGGSGNAGLWSTTELMEQQMAASVPVLPEPGHLCRGGVTAAGQPRSCSAGPACGTGSWARLWGAPENSLCMELENLYPTPLRNKHIIQDLNYRRMLEYMFVVAVRGVFQSDAYIRTEGECLGGHSLQQE